MQQWLCDIINVISRQFIHLSIITIMFNQKFNPYGQFPSKSNQLYEEEYEDEESQPLIEEVDDSYEPTDKEVKEYAIETLGMKFPEDEGLLYLAREGLKAPLPDNWVPYEGRDGQVYYKHRITQEKTYDHPTDLEYRKKYEQQKEKMARKNLKSMNMKASSQLGIGHSNNLNSNSNLFASKLSNSNLFSSNPIAQSTPTVKLDPRIEQEYEEVLQEYDERLKKEWKDFEIQERQRCQTRIKKLKQEYEAEIDKLFKSKQKEVRLEDKIKAEKDKIKAKVEQQLEEAIKEEVREYEKQLQLKNREFSSVYEEDMQLKVSKYQQEKDNQFRDKEQRLNQANERMSRQREDKKREIEETLKRLRDQFENGENREIEVATAEALEQELLSIKQTYAQKLKDKQAELEREYLQTRRILGFDQNAYLSQIAAKKSRIKAISQQKIESYKKKELQSFNQQNQNQLDDELKAIKQQLTEQYSRKLEEQRKVQEQRLASMKERLDRQLKSKAESNIENIYDEVKTKIKNYEAEMNKKLSSVQERFINDIYGKSKQNNKDITFRIESKEKEMMIENKAMMINSLKRQQQLETITLELMKLQSELYRCRDEHQIDQKLIKVAKEHGLEYRTEKYLKFEQLYKQLREKYKKDKEFLASVMNSLQNYKGGNGIGSQVLLKQYNQDVRTMRQNQEMLSRLESLLKRAEVNDKPALEELSNLDTQYKQIQLKKEMMRTGSLSSQAQIQQLAPSRVQQRKQAYSGSRDIQTALKDHSRFLSSMRSELNRKLYKIRSGAYY